MILECRSAPVALLLVAWLDVLRPRLADGLRGLALLA